jgi:fatty acid-binding protein DegV
MVNIITDTTSCLPEEIAQRFSITIIPQIINLSGKSFYENIEIDINTFMTFIRSSNEIPKTAAPPPELFVREFERLIPKGKQSFVFTLLMM